MNYYFVPIQLSYIFFPLTMKMWKFPKAENIHYSSFENKTASGSETGNLLCK